MAKVLRKTERFVSDFGTSFNELKAFVVAQMRLAKADLATATGAGTSWTALGSHNDRSEKTVTAADATDLATSLLLVNEIRSVYEFHRADTLAHLNADATNTITAPAATDLTTAQTLANELKADYNLHRSQATVHAATDSGNAISAADASNQGTLNTLLNELKADLNLHMAGGVSAKSVRIVGA